MGTDIHGVWQKRAHSGWEDVPSEYDQRRHYLLFAWLAGVRNGYGFAGVPTHESIAPIAEPRGLPADFSGADEEEHPVLSLELLDPRRRLWHDDDEPLSIWMGDHTHSWLTAEEILTALRPSDLVRYGIVDMENYQKFLESGKPPESYCGGVSGSSIVLADSPEQIQPNTTHVRITWQADGDGLDYFVDEVRRLRDLHGEVRFVFGFDS